MKLPTNIRIPALRLGVLAALCALPAAHVADAFAQDAGALPAGVVAGPDRGTLDGSPLGFASPLDKIDYAATVFVDDGAIVKNRSDLSKVQGSLTGSGGRHVTITSNTQHVNGVYTKGRTRFTLADSTVDIAGHSLSADENHGVGAGITAGKGSEVVLKNVKIRADGAHVSAAIAADGVLRIYDSELVSHGGQVAEENRAPGSGPGFFGPPEPLEMEGTARTVNVIGSGHAYIYHSHISADGWGAVSTDSASKDGVVLEVHDSEVEARPAGYGTYADNNCDVKFFDTHFHTHDYTGIISGDGKIAFTNVTEDTAKHGVMLHAPGREFQRIATLAITGGEFTTRQSLVFVKSHNADIVLDGVKAHPGDGAIIKSVINDSKRSPMLRTLLEPPGGPGGAGGPPMQAAEPAPSVQPVHGIHAVLRNMPDLAGNIEHFDTMRTMDIALENTTLSGDIVGSTWAITDIRLKLDANSRWHAKHDGRVTLLQATDASRFDAPAGVMIIAIAGEGTTLRGTYPLASGGRLIVKQPAPAAKK
ncbi:MAG: hypothetical protein QM601_13880 [Pseudoxanthomonas sp.]